MLENRNDFVLALGPNDLYVKISFKIDDNGFGDDYAKLFLLINILLICHCNICYVRIQGVLGLPGPPGQPGDVGEEVL